MTEAGLVLYNTVAGALREIAASSLELLQVDEYHLTVWCEPALASEWLTGKLYEFAYKHPEIEVSLKPTDEAPQFTADFPDVQIHCLPHDGKSEPASVFRSTIIAQPDQIVVAGVEFAASSIDVSSADDLLHYRLLHEKSSEGWQIWFQAHDVQIDELPGPRFWHGHLILAAARRNQGVALTNRLLASEGLGQEELIEIETTPLRRDSYYFTTLESAWTRSAVAKFRAWVLEAARSSLADK